MRKGNQRMLNLLKKKILCQVITRHIFVDAPRSFIEELKSGLRTLGVLDKVVQYPEQFSDIFTSENMKPLDAQAVDLLFKVNFAEQGTNCRSSQERTIVYWRDYLQDCECEFCTHVLNNETFTRFTKDCMVIHEIQTHFCFRSAGETSATLEDVLVFVTVYLSHATPLGF